MTLTLQDKILETINNSIDGLDLIKLIAQGYALFRDAVSLTGPAKDTNIVTAHHSTYLGLGRVGHGNSFGWTDQSTSTTAHTLFFIVVGLAAITHGDFRHLGGEFAGIGTEHDRLDRFA